MERETKFIPEENLEEQKPEQQPAESGEIKQQIEQEMAELEENAKEAESLRPAEGLKKEKNQEDILEIIAKRYQLEKQLPLNNVIVKTVVQEMVDSEVTSLWQKAKKKNRG